MPRYTLSSFDRRSWRAAVQLVKDLTGSTLLEARRRVNAQEELVVELDHDQAAWIAQRIVDDRIVLACVPTLPEPALSSEPALASAQAQQAWVHEFATREGRMLIAYAPEHPAGVDQALTRARCEGGEARWVMIERGRIGEWEMDEHLREVDDVDGALDELAQRWRARGLRIAEDPVEIIRHFSAQDPELERSVRRAGADSHDAREVYFDWLAGQGDPRGRVGQLQRALARATTPLQRLVSSIELDALVRRHAKHLALPVATFGGLGASWTLALSEDYRRGALHWERSLQLPTFACLRALSLSGDSSRRSPAIRFPLELETLEGLQLLGCSGVAPRKALAFSHLRHLALDHHGFEGLVGARLPALHTLELTAEHNSLEDPDFIAALRSLQDSPIERLCLDFGRTDDAQVLVAGIRAAVRLPALRELSIVAVPDPDPVVADPWLEVLAELPSIAGLASLDVLEFGEPDTNASESLTAALLEAHGRSPQVVCWTSPYGYRHADPARWPRGYAPAPMGYALHIERDARGHVRITSRAARRGPHPIQHTLG